MIIRMNYKQDLFRSSLTLEVFFQFSIRMHYEILLNKRNVVDSFELLFRPFHLAKKPLARVPSFINQLKILTLLLAFVSYGF